MAVTSYLYEHTRPATMTTIAAPLLARHTSSLFQLSAAKDRIHSRLQGQLQSENAALREEVMLRGQAWLYLEDFLRRSPWEDIMDQIAIVRDAVPTMPELNSYGGLDEEEGTKACRRLFKAVVVWDELGHSLWETLRAASEQRRLAQRQFEQAAALDACADDDFYISASRRSSRRASGASDASDASEGSVDSTHSTACEKRQQRPLLKLTKKLGSSSSRRGSSESSRERCSCCAANQQQARLSHEGGSRSAIPKMISHNCASAVRRTLGVIGEGRTSLSMGRQLSR